MQSRALLAGFLAFALAPAGAAATDTASEPPAGWVELFDGKTLDGWQVRCLPADAEKNFWSVRDGAIVCDALGRGDHDYVWLMHEGEWGDFELELEFQAFRASPGNTGVQIRSRYDAAPSAPRGGWLDGPQIDIHPPAPFRTGLIYDETRTENRWVYPSLPSWDIEPRPTPAGFTFVYGEDGDRWNQLRVVARGTSITTVLNGVTMAAYDGAGVLDNESHRALGVGLRGQIALQLHMRDETRVRYRHLRIRALPPGEDKTAAVWPGGAAGAVSLSYDDALPVHHRLVAPLLEEHGLRATFYLIGQNVGDGAAWKAVAARGHELGNHSLFHPCRRDPPGNYGWLAAHYDLSDYTPGRFRDELAMTNTLLGLLDGGKPRTYGNTCTNLTIGRGANEVPMDPILAELFVAARGTITNRPVDPVRPEFTRLGHYGGDRKSFDQLRAEIEAARAAGGWIIYMFHGVGEGTHSLFIAEEEHRKLVEWLDRERASIWTAPIVEVAQHLKAAGGR